MANDHLRGRFWVSARIQGRILARIACYWAIYHVVLWNTIFVARYVAYRAAIITGESETRTLGELYSEFARDYFGLALCAVLLAPIFMYDFFRQTHRIAGPLVRFQSSFRRLIASEKVAPIKLRKGDLLTEFQDVFNEFVKFYNEKYVAPAMSEKLNEKEAAILEQVTQVRAAVLHDVEEMAAEAASGKFRLKAPVEQPAGR